MGILSDLESHARDTFNTSWTTRQGRVVPAPADLKLSNDAVEFDRATVLYADLTASTTMVDSFGWALSAEVYKTFLFCAGKIIRAEGGSITSYDGDRVMGLFVGEYQTTRAARCGLKINWAVQKIINPAFNKQYPGRSIKVSQVVGIDTSAVRAARTGVRGDNDIVWVGGAANYAAKLTDFNTKERTWITERGYKRLADKAKFGGIPRRLMWKEFTWPKQNNVPIYGSVWTWSVT